MEPAYDADRDRWDAASLGDRRWLFPLVLERGFELTRCSMDMVEVLDPLRLGKMDVMGDLDTDTDIGLASSTVALWSSSMNESSDM